MTLSDRVRLGSRAPVSAVGDGFITGIRPDTAVDRAREVKVQRGNWKVKERAPPGNLRSQAGQGPWEPLPLWVLSHPLEVSLGPWWVSRASGQHLGAELDKLNLWGTPGLPVSTSDYCDLQRVKGTASLLLSKSHIQERHRKAFWEMYFGTISISPYLNLSSPPARLCFSHPSMFPMPA